MMIDEKDDTEILDDGFVRRKDGGPVEDEEAGEEGAGAEAESPEALKLGDVLPGGIAA